MTTPFLVAHFKDEYHLFKELDIPGTANAVDIKNNGMYWYFVLEDVTGKMIRTLINEGVPVFPDLFFPAAMALCQTLEKLHARSVICGILHPEAVLLDSSTGQTCLFDFSYAIDLSGRLSFYGVYGTIPLTILPYLAPELTHRMNKMPDYRTDLYSLGCLFYYMLTGRPVFESDKPAQITYFHLTKVPEPVHTFNRNVPDMVNDIVQRLLAKNPEARYQSVTTLLADLETAYNFWKKDRFIPHFDIGTDDTKSVFSLPSTLYGRKKELLFLQTLFQASLTAGSQLVLVKGQSGLGKSSLVDHFGHFVASKQAYFVSGKFEQFKYNTPYSAFIYAFRELTRQVLAEPADRIRYWRERVSAYIGRNVSIITEQVPEFSYLAEEQFPLDSLSFLEAQNRFNLTILNFLRTFSSDDHPLVIFLDDLQWADMGSLELLKVIFEEQMSIPLMIVGSYRENEVDALHPLLKTLTVIREKGVSVNDVQLYPLSQEDMLELVCESFSVNPRKAQSLAAFLLQVTGGNPFFARQLLLSFYNDGAIYFDPADSQWNWNFKKIQSRAFDEGVIAILRQKIDQLGPEVLRVLQVAACIGTDFSTDLMAAVLEGLTAPDISKILETALSQSLIILIGPVKRWAATGEDASHPPEVILAYRFIHDQIRQYIYTAIDPDTKAHYHLTIGRFLARQMDKLRYDDVFEVVNQLNSAQSLITEKKEKLETAQLNLKAAMRAKNANAYAVAVTYFRTGMALLEEDAWNDNFDLAWKILVERAECEYLTGQTDDGNYFFDMAYTRAPDDMAKVRILNKKVVLYTLRGKPEEAVSVGFTALDLLGVPVSRKSSPLTILLKVFEVRLMIGFRDIKALKRLPQMTDEKYKLAITILSAMSSPAYLFNVNLFTVLYLEMFKLTLKYGMYEISPMALISYGLILSAAFERHQAGNEIGQVGLELALTYNRPILVGKSYILFYGFIYYWVHPLRDLPDNFMMAHQLLRDSGDLVWATYALTYELLRSYVAGVSLDMMIERCENALEFSRRYNHVDQIYTHEIIYQVALSFKGQVEGRPDITTDTFNEADYLKAVKDCPNKNAEAWYYMNKAQYLYVLGYYEQGLALMDACMIMIQAGVGKGIFYVADCHFYHALLLLAQGRARGVASYSHVLAKVRKHRKKLAAWAKSCPENFRHKYLIITAELAAIRGRDVQAIEWFDEAITAAVKYEFLQDAAIACELAARVFLAEGRNRFSRLYLNDAVFYYKKWGASVKAEKLIEHYFSPAESEADSYFSSVSAYSRPARDLDALMESSHAISSQLELRKVMEIVITNLLQHSGAKRGYLFLKEADTFVLAAKGEFKDDMRIELASMDISLVEDIPLSIVYYAGRTQEIVVIDNLAVSTKFSKDPYFSSHRHGCLICLPLSRQEKVLGVVYLDNNEIVNVFTEEKVEMIRVLSTQAAISLENSQLYANLEEKVAARTLELAQINKELQDFAHVVSHDLKAPLRSISSLAKWLEEDMGDKLAGMARQQLDLMVDRTKKMQDLIDGILQYSRAGISHESKRPVDIAEIVEETLSLLGSPDHVEVKRDTPLPVVRFEPSKIRQVFQNLIGNAFKYMDKEKGIVHIGCEDEGKAWRFYVSDNGPGMNEEDQKEIFKLFHTAKGDRIDGTGIGLSIVKKIVESAGGEIWVESMPGEGSVFYFTVIKG